MSEVARGPANGAPDGGAPETLAPAGGATDAGPGAATAAVEDEAGGAGAATPSPSGVDLGRRRFFRQFATDIFHTAASVAGAATALQRTTAQAAGAILNPEAATLPPVTDVADPAPPVAQPAPAQDMGFLRPGARPTVRQPTGFRSAFRVDDELLVLVDQRQLPDRLEEVEVRSAVELGQQLRAGVMCSGPAAGQAAAVAMALTAAKSRRARPYGRRAILRAAATQLNLARPTSRYVANAVERVMAAYEEVGEFSEDGDAISGAIWAEAEAMLREASADLGRIGRLGTLLLPKPAPAEPAPSSPSSADSPDAPPAAAATGADARPIGILVRGAIGALAGGQVGTVMAVLRAATDAGREVLVHVAETRPALTGARVTAWELEQAGIPHVVVTDGAVGWLLEAGRIDLVLVGAERIAANGDLAGDGGTYPLAVLAKRHGVPFGVCAPMAAVDFAAEDGRALPVAQGPAFEVTRVSGITVTPPRSDVLNPVTDVTPADLVTAVVTEEGLVRAPYDTGLVAAWHARSVRHGVPRTGGPPTEGPRTGGPPTERPPTVEVAG